MPFLHQPTDMQMVLRYLKPELAKEKELSASHLIPYMQ